MLQHPRYYAQIVHQDLQPRQDEYNAGNIVMTSTLVLRGRLLAPRDEALEQLSVELRRHNKPVDFFDFGARREMQVQPDNEGQFVFGNR